jgi:hypothetical protein
MHTRPLRPLFPATGTSVKEEAGHRGYLSPRDTPNSAGAPWPSD